MRPTVITVFGSARAAEGTPAYETARALGRAVAERGWTLCNGGYGGTMEASARGAVEVGGHTIGVTCRIFGRSGPNPHIRQEVPTFDLLTRLNTLVRLGDAYVVLPGGTGTMLELALVWELFNKKLLRRRAPIILVGEHWQALAEPILREQPEALRLPVVPDGVSAVALIRDVLSAGSAGDENPPPAS